MHWCTIDAGSNLLFFFSSRRRHTRLQGDWSSDVCSSDLSTTSRARTSRCARRATTAGSRNCRAPPAPRAPARPRSGWAPDEARGNEPVTSGPPPPPSILPRERHHLLVLDIERFAPEAAVELPAREPRHPQQQL